MMNFSAVHHGDPLVHAFSQATIFDSYPAPRLYEVNLGCAGPIPQSRLSFPQVKIFFFLFEAFITHTQCI